MVRSLETRLVVMVGLGMLAALAIFAVVASQFAERAALNLLESRLEATADQLAEVIEVSPDGTLGITRALDETRFLRPQSGWGWIVVKGGKVIGQSRSLAGRNVEGLVRRPPDGHPVSPFGAGSAVVERVLDQASGLRAIMVAPLEDNRADLAAMRLMIVLITLALAAVLLVGILLQVRWGLAPLRRMVRDIDALRRGSIASVPASGISTLDPVADAVNRLALALRHAAERSREDAVNLAHAIKTPLALVMLRAGPGGSSVDLPTFHAAELIQRQLDRRLRRSRLGTPAGLGRPLQRLRPVIDDAILAATHARRDRNIAVHIEMPDSASVGAAREDLDETLGALLDNAVKWAGSRVEVGVSLDGGEVVITIDDDGPGIPDDRIDEVLMRGRRLDEAASGQGLGLAIATDILADLGGSLALRRSGLGGLRVEVRLSPADGRDA